MTKLLDGFASVETKRMDNGHIIAIIRKKTEQNELPIQLQTYVDDGKIKENCVKFSYSFNTIIPPCLKV